MLIENHLHGVYLFKITRNIEHVHARVILLINTLNTAVLNGSQGPVLTPEVGAGLMYISALSVFIILYLLLKGWKVPEQERGQQACVSV